MQVSISCLGQGICTRNWEKVFVLKSGNEPAYIKLLNDLILRLIRRQMSIPILLNLFSVVSPFACLKRIQKLGVTYYDDFKEQNGYKWEV